MRSRRKTDIGHRSDWFRRLARRLREGLKRKLSSCERDCLAMLDLRERSRGDEIVCSPSGTIDDGAPAVEKRLNRGHTFRGDFVGCATLRQLARQKFECTCGEACPTS